MPGTGIVLVLYNQKSNLDLLYNSLTKQSVNKFVVYFIDNNPADGGVQYSEKINIKYQLNIKYYPQSKNTGFAEGNNIGARHAADDGCDTILILNNDTELNEKGLEELLMLLEHENVGAVGPIILLGKKGEGDHIIQEYGAKLNLKYYLIKKYFTGIPYNENAHLVPLSQEVDFLSGCAIMIKTEVFYTAGLWDERYFAYGDEIDLSKRLSDNNIKLMVTKKAIVWHNHNWSKANKRGYYFEYYMIQRNKYLFLKKHNYYSGLIFNLLKDLIFLPRTFNWLIKICDSKLFLFYVKGMFDGLINRNGNPNLNYE